MTPNETVELKPMDGREPVTSAPEINAHSRSNPCARQPSVVALGMFDGVHIGHQALVRQAVAIARNHGWCSVVYTFENHPRSVFGQTPSLLMDAVTRRAALSSLGADRVDMVKFTRTLGEKSPRSFLKLLLNRYDVRAVVAGQDFTFGHRGAGNINTLRMLGSEMGFEVYEMPVVLLDGEKVSSTRIRAALQSGNEDLAARMLGR
jgi:riboflavin kinase / FMN adenylyltransferase